MTNASSIRGKYTVDQFMSSETIVTVSVNDDNQTILYASDQSGVFNAHTVYVDGTNQTQVTHSIDESIFPITYLPNSYDFIFQQDHGGNEISHLYLYQTNGSITDLTPSENEKASFLQWDKNRDSFYYLSNKRDTRFFDLYQMHTSSWTAELVFENKDGLNVETVSPNGKQFAIQHTVTDNESNMYLYSVKDGLIQLNHQPGEAEFTPMMFSQDSSELYFITNETSEFLQLKKINLSTNNVTIVADENWNIEWARFSPQYSLLMYSYNDDAQNKLKVINQNSDDFQLPEFPDMNLVDMKLSHDERAITFLVNSSVAPTDLFGFTPSNTQLNRLTYAQHPEIQSNELVKAEIVRYESFDDLTIPAVYYEPHLNDNEKAPALVLVHGGPGGQATTDYIPLIQYLVNQGYAIIAVNNRGSSGYGKSFFKAADKQHGEIDLQDCIEAKKYLISTGRIDEERIGIMGGSYGGYMVLAALAFQPNSFKVGVDIFGVSNWERTLKEIPSWWESARQALYKKIGDPYHENDYIRSISPLFHADNIHKPLIVLQGANDPRVLKVESDEIVDEVKKNGVPVEYIVFEDEGHGFTKRTNQIMGYQTIKTFLDKHL
ncbi:S9 family peptidase [Alkalibacillus salilacus]|uniref:Acyl-peptide hydrolase n=1 Tax=Alkalibacillus salilacus TaxID=284582 RepID=A0ABT9VGI3_9BACI|nr:S9 family peptidase [Alkalibacillus salilacus]MDQ0160078.1 dipeptidyl aminopeptidase/acylaminoacyl peptidase [Alkalibacillus salilacus]